MNTFDRASITRELTRSFSPALIFLLAGLILSSCAKDDNTAEENSKRAREHMVQSVLWFQTAAEARALQYQAFNLARIILDEDLKRSPKDARNRAIIVDVDETVLDNSRYEGRMIKENTSYPAQWDEWIDLARAEPIAGAIDFLTYADAKDVEIFYVTNRTVRDKGGTLENLKHMGFPQAIESHLFLMTDGSSKEARRQTISEKHRIVLLMGDNLNDFAQVFEKLTLDYRTRVVDSLRLEFGKRFIVLPNPIYGDWEDALFNYSRDLSEREKRSRRLDVLKSF